MRKHKMIAALFALIFAVPLFAAPLPASAEDAQADEPCAVHAEIAIPQSELEYYDLNGPTDVYCDDEITAVLEAENKKLIIYMNGKFSVFQEDFADVSQIRRLGNYLIMQDDLKLCAFSLSDNSYKQIADTDGELMTGKYFATNGKYLISLSTTQINLYKVEIADIGETLRFIRHEVSSITTGSTNRIAINDNDDFFYFDSQGVLCRKNIESLHLEPTKYIANTAPNGMIADNSYIYLSSSAGIEKIDIGGGSSRIIKHVSASGDRLEDLSAPMEMAFRGKNLLVCDKAGDKIIEITTDDEAAFTGFAITTTANAYNRLTENTTGVSSLGDAVAITNKGSLTLKTGSTFKNLTMPFAAPMVALGSVYAAVATQSDFALIDIASGEIVKVDQALFPNSIAYADGKFFIRSYPDDVFIVDENSREVTLAADGLTSSATDKLAADIDGNFFIYHDYAGKYEISMYSPGEAGYSHVRTYTLSKPSLGIAADLNGNIYSLCAGNMLQFFRGGDDAPTGEAQLILSENLPEDIEATAFSLAFDSDTVYFLFDKHGLLLSADDLGNDCITHIAIPEQFRIADVTAAEKDFDVVSITEGANVYSASFDFSAEYFDYTGHAHAAAEEYVRAASADGFDILVGNDLLLVKSRDVQVAESAFSPADIASGFTNTAVSLYYFPLLTREGRYALTGFTRLTKDAPLDIISRVTVNGRSFYYARYGDVSGYIPCDYVTEKLAVDFTVDRYTYKTVNGSGRRPVTVYADAALSDAVAKIASATRVRARDVGGNVWYVEYALADGSLVQGYVRGGDFLDRGKNAVRNALIVAAIALSVAVTSLYFINRKQDA